MKKFADLYRLACNRKGGEAALEKLLTPITSSEQLARVSDARYLAQLTRCVFNAGFHWRVIAAKWSGFEQAFERFDLGLLLTKSPQEWEAYLEDTRIIRNWQKIETVYKNALMIEEVAADHGSFAHFFGHYPVSDQVGLMMFLHKHGARLGGKTAQWFIRFTGKDSFVLSTDVITALIANGVDTSERASSQRDLRTIQNAFNEWQQQSGRPITHISKILSYTTGDNVPVDVLSCYEGSQTIL